ncbi:MAG TPA: hypothetical protein VIH24_02030, partial [Candidatus Limnocylindria bacterium]
NHGLSVRAVARLAGVAPDTQRRIEAGDPAVQLDTLCRCASVVGLRVWARAYPRSTPSLRDTGQLWVAEQLRRAVHGSLSVAFEVGLGNLRAADMVVSGPDEIIHVEIERYLADFQAQYRSAAEKRDLLSASHRRPVRLVVVVEDTQHNRAAVRAHSGVIHAAMPAASREVLRALRGGTPLGRDGWLWIRRMTAS